MNANIEITKQIAKVEVNEVDFNNRIYKLIKRTVDVIAAIGGCAILIPLTIFIYIANCLCGDIGPVFYVQKRIGRNGKPFKMYKYRSMVINADRKLKKYLLENQEANEEFIKYRKLKNDPRVTSIGLFLRKSSLDEFPQFINILKGDMSLVGPRPYLFREKRAMKEKYNEIIKVKPGLTGPWQVSGRSETDFIERLKLDEDYSKKCSFLLDMKYFFKTFQCGLRKKEHYNNMKILITGSKGMLAYSVKQEFSEYELVCTDINELDITNLKLVKEFISNTKPDLIINCAAYTAVDKAEEQEEIAYQINAIGPRNLAIAASENDTILVHISTDYVFGGDKPLHEYYYENDEKNPKTIYGKTKLAGEKFIEEYCPKYYIFRTAWLYGEGNNFVRTMINLSKDKNEVSVVNDQYGSPTFALDLARIIKQAIERNIPFGVYNATNIGFTTWYEFTKKIYKIKKIDCKVKPVTSDEFPRLAKRPYNSKMSKEKLMRHGIIIPDYENALIRYLEK